MKRDRRLLLGPFAALALAIGIIVLGALVPGYDPVRQTVSEIGEIGSPMRVAFALMLAVVGVSVMAFGSALDDWLAAAEQHRIGGWLVAFMGLDAVLLGFFAFPHPMHNVCGLAELVGYQAPLVLALTWQRRAETQPLARLCWIGYALVCLSLIANLTALHREGVVWDTIRPVYGLVQRALFAAWFGWLAVLGWRLWRLGVPVRTPRNG